MSLLCDIQLCPRSFCFYCNSCCAAAVEAGVKTTVKILIHNITSKCACTLQVAESEWMLNWASPTFVQYLFHWNSFNDLHGETMHRGHCDIWPGGTRNKAPMLCWKLQSIMHSRVTSSCQSHTDTKQKMWLKDKAFVGNFSKLAQSITTVILMSQYFSWLKANWTRINELVQWFQTFSRTKILKINVFFVMCT